MARLRRACLLLAAGFAAWVAIAWVTGGVTIWIGEFRLLSARGLRNPFLLAVISAAAWWLAAPRHSRMKVLRADLARARQGVASRTRDGVAAAQPTLVPLVRAARRGACRLGPWVSPAVGLTAVAGVILVGFLEGIFVAGGSDSWGYVSQAHLWATGTLRIEEPLIRELADLLPTEALTPLGYRPSIQGDALVPMYAPGFPMVMALFERIGGRQAVFYALPLLAGVAVWATYLLGRAIAGPAAGAGGALLLATSPAFLFQLTAAPMSDIPATAWWALALVLVTVDRTSTASLAGLAAGLAVLTRPNLVILAIFPAVLLAWPVLRDRRDATALTRTALYSAGVAAACLTIAAVNTYWYGWAVQSGYGPTFELYGWSNLALNLQRYSSWLVETQTPLVALAVAAPFFVPSHATRQHSRFGPRTLAAVAWCFAAVVLGSYLLYMPFDVWWYLRFLLPGFPVLTVSMSITVLGLTRRLPGLIRGPVAAAVIGVLAWNGYAIASEKNVFDSESDRKYAVIGRHVDRRLPKRAVLLAMQHSGSIRYYSDRPTLRYDWIKPEDIGTVISRLQALDYVPYIVLEEWEVDEFRRHFSTSGQIGALDWPPVAQLPLGDIRIYAAGARDGTAHSTLTETVADTFQPGVP
jgi:hypothetical protein